MKNYPQKAEFSIEIFCKGSNFLTKEINYKLFYSGLVEFLAWSWKRFEEKNWKISFTSLFWIGNVISGARLHG